MTTTDHPDSELGHPRRLLDGEYAEPLVEAVGVPEVTLGDARALATATERAS